MKKKMYLRHLYCPDCAAYHRPFKRQAGITLHFIWVIMVDRDNNVCFGSACSICGVVRDLKTDMITITKEKRSTIPAKDWNALMSLKPNDDGWF